MKASAPVGGTTRLIAIFGHPLTYTLSPVFQNRGLQAAGVDAVYVPVPVKPEYFGEAFRGFLRAENALGANITNPFKRAVIPLLQGLTPEAKAIGAVNTVWRKNKAWWGHNTDWSGFLAAAAALRRDPFKGRRVWLLGAGGAARGLAFACLKGGAAQVAVMARRAEQANGLCRDLDPRLRRLEPREMDPAALAQALPGDWVLNTVPDAAFSAAAGRALGKVRRGVLVYDIVYDPPATPILRASAKAGHQVVNGLGMLLEQGRQAFTMWTGKTALRKPMWDALRQAAPKS